MYQGIRIWYRCYHSTQYPATTFVHLESMDDGAQESSFQEPIANSTLIDATVSSLQQRSLSPRSNINSATYSATVNPSVHFDNSPTDNSHGVGHMSHIPRTPPSPATYTVPSIIHKATGTELETEDLYGMVKLKESDVCYTSGTIEWVGRKRSFPINSGFKIINESSKPKSTEPLIKKIKKVDRTFTSGEADKVRECDCTNVLPTVNAIVDHLNALHEAVDLVDLRLTTLEDVVSQN